MESAQADERTSRERVLSVVNTLKEDLDRCWEAVEKDDSPFWRRGFVRAAFALIEGTVYTMKLEAVARHRYLSETFQEEGTKDQDPPQKGKLSAGTYRAFNRMINGAGFSQYEIQLLLEVTEEIDDKGERKVRLGNRITLEKNVLFAFRALGQSYNVRFLLNKGEAGWGFLKSAIKVRDRLMHPKRERDLSVSDEELEATMKAYLWILEQHGALYKRCVEAIKERRDAPTFDTPADTQTPGEEPDC
jgi:hypothetical protein